MFVGNTILGKLSFFVLILSLFKLHYASIKLCNSIICKGNAIEGLLAKLIIFFFILG